MSGTTGTITTTTSTATLAVESMEPDTYEVVQFGPEGRGTFARYRGGEPA